MVHVLTKYATCTYLLSMIHVLTLWSLVEDREDIDHNGDSIEHGQHAEARFKRSLLKIVLKKDNLKNVAWYTILHKISLLVGFDTK